MPFTNYPSAQEVEALIRSAGYWPLDTTKHALAQIQAQIGVEAARDEFERLTGWNPFMASDTPTQRLFDSTDQNGYLDFQGAAVAVTSLSIAGQPQNLGTHFHLQPQNAASRGEAILGLQLGSRSHSALSTPGTIAVTARWGRVDAIPGDVYQAISQKAALIVLTQIENLQSVASISEDGFSKAYDIVGIVTQKDLVTGVWSKDFDRIAARWKRVIC